MKAISMRKHRVIRQDWSHWCQWSIPPPLCDKNCGAPDQTPAEGLTLHHLNLVVNIRL